MVRCPLTVPKLPLVEIGLNCLLMTLNGQTSVIESVLDKIFVETCRMNTDHVNKRLNLGANLAVLIGIALLVFELHQNRQMVRAQTRAEISGELTDLLSQVAGDSHLANLIRRADNGEDPTPDEATQYGHRSAAMFRQFENCRKGLV